MKVSLNWLSKYVDTSNLSANKIAKGLTEAGLEVEGIVFSKPVKELYVAYVKQAQKHPDAKKLNVCTVFDGKKDHQIICGAPNVAAGQHVVLAKPGAVLPGNFKIEEATIRGVKSSGMLCSERELGLSEEHEGIIVLGEDVSPGEDANAVLGLGDTVFEIGITPNRGDCLSIYGVARDFAAVFNRALYFVPFAVDDDTDEDTADALGLCVDSMDGCPYYTARIIRGIQQGQSPQWMQRRLRSAGMRPISNVVDVTNYIMLEYGQPMHAFDLKVVDKSIIVRYAKNGEKITTLDGKERVLDEKMQVIADKSKIIGLAGVMGGEFSGIHEDTKDVVLEVAYFDPKITSYTSKKLGINSDSAYRYIRGVDHGRTRMMLDYAADLISEICGGNVLRKALTFGQPPAPVRIVKASRSRIADLIGKRLSADTMSSLLERLGMPTTIKGDTLTVSVPSHRPDVLHEASVAEEVARLYGISKLPVTLPKFTTDALPLNAFESSKKRARYQLADMGFNESINYSFMSQEYLSMFDDCGKMVCLINPLSEEMSTLRTLVSPGLIRAIESNWNQGERSIRMFEFATVFEKSRSKQPKEKTHLAFGAMGDFIPLSWAGKGGVDTFYHMKSVCDNLLHSMKLKASYAPSGEIYMHPGKSADITVNGKRIGVVGALHPDIEDGLDIKSQIYIAELDFSLMVELSKQNKVEYKEFSRFPSIYKDISVIVAKDAPAAGMSDVISSVSGDITDVVLYDVYTGKGIEDNEQSVTFRIFFSAVDRTLTDEEINPLLTMMADGLGKAYGARLR